jgi:DNA mismatch endonuclease (patch repair protein)
MADVVDKKTRSRMMSNIKSKDTKPELLIRKALHAKGYRYKLHTKDLPGKPDIVLPKHRAVVFIHGCFWHGHDCHLFKWPKDNQEFWENKINTNKRNDSKHNTELQESGWRVMIVWECSIKGRKNIGLEQTIAALDLWVKSGNRLGSISATSL